MIYLKRLILPVLAVTLWFPYKLLGQIDMRVKPVSFSQNLSDNIPETNVAFSKAKVLNDSSALLRPNTFAIDLNVNIGLQNGKWDTLSDGNKIWRIQINSKGAMQLNVSFDKFKLPPGGKLFIYDLKKRNISEEINHTYNNVTNTFVSPFIYGESIIIEYYHIGNTKLPDFHINNIGYDFTNNALVKTISVDPASCQLNISCPQNGNFSILKNAVFKYAGKYQGSGNNLYNICTGTLINNTKQDGRPLFLSANHCVEDPNLIFSSITGYFKYEANGTVCQTNEVNTGNIVTLSGGATLLSRWANSDFALLEFNRNIPAAAEPFFAGWDRRDTFEGSTVVIHHPRGGVKKFSKDYDQAEKGAGFDGVTTAWRSVLNYGASTEPGSSGSALISEANQLIIGQLLGVEYPGDPFNACDIFNITQVYGRLAHSWNGGGTSTTRLKDHIDPITSGVGLMAGNECPNIAVTGLQSSLIAGTYVRLEWTGGYITPYTIEYRKAGESTWQSTITEENATWIYSLSMNTNYEWRVKTRCSGFSGISTFKTYPTLGDISFPKFLFCPGQTTSISLPIEGGEYISYYNFTTVQLSNTSGSFDSPVIIGTVNFGYSGGDISVTIPADTPLGTKYRMRIVMTSPEITKNSAYDVEIGTEAPIVQAVTACPESYTEISKIWEKAYGGNKEDELRQIIPANDEGMLLFGSSKSEGNPSTDKSDANRGNYDYWLVKIDANKNKMWDRAYGGTDSDRGTAIIPTLDGGYLIGGNSYSPADGDKSQDHVGESDFWVVKISSNGYKIWDKRFGGSLNDELSKIIQTADGGFLLAGRSNSIANGNKTKPNHNGSYDYWVIKISSDGATVTDWVFGGNDDETLTGFIQTSDGGYLLGGHSKSGSEGERSESSRGNNDFWIVKVDANFNQLWDKRYGGGGEDLMASNGIAVASDGNYVIAGRSDSNVTGDKNEPSWFNTPDFWVLKINSQNRNIIKQHRFGGGGEDGNNALLPTPDGGFLLAGGSNSNITGNKSELSWFDTYDYWIMKVDGNLEHKWNKRFGGGGDDFGMTLARTSDGNYLIGGFTDSNASGDKANGDVSKGLTDFWVVKFNDCQTSASTTVNIGQKAFLSATNCSGTVTWSNGQTGNHIVVKPTVNTNYTATCLYGCTSGNSSTLIITVDPCPTAYTLTSPNDDYNNAPTTLKAKASTGSLSATNKITGTSNVVYEGQKIMLNPGFETTQGTIFKAQTGGCN
ncbi:3-coathanger stack domain-containing protein [Runella sp.]|uniref:3-coathanger stack domain-containing protein n=1 Tax=Runella sp. TaxID=1960881 RepID=UPI003D097154